MVSTHLNALSLSEEKFTELRVKVIINNISIICVNETVLKDYMDDTNLSIEGFSIERKGRRGRSIINSLIYNILSNQGENEFGYKSCPYNCLENSPVYLMYTLRSDDRI